MSEMLNEKPVLIWSATKNKWISTLIYFTEEPAIVSNTLDTDEQPSIVPPVSTPVSSLPTLEPLSGYRETLPLGSIFPTSEIWYVDNTKNKKIIEKNITWARAVPIIIIYKFYALDGITIDKTIRDQFFYTNKIFVSYITRSLL